MGPVSKKCLAEMMSQQNILLQYFSAIKNLTKVEERIASQESLNGRAMLKSYHQTYIQTRHKHFKPTSVAKRVLWRHESYFWSWTIILGSAVFAYISPSGTAAVKAWRFLVSVWHFWHGWILLCIGGLGLECRRNKVSCLLSQPGLFLLESHGDINWL